MENEENKGLNDKKASESQFMTFVSSVLEQSLSYSCTVRVFLEHSWIQSKKAKEN